MIELNGKDAEGGGQILRSALALALATGQAFRLVEVRGNRAKPGLMRQHLTALRAAAAVCNGRVTGDDLGSRTVTFAPGPVQPGHYKFEIGTAGSTVAVLQALLPALAKASAASSVTITGGTHNPMAPPFDYLATTLAPQLTRIGWNVRFTLQRPGFAPAGGGALTAHLAPAGQLETLHLHERGHAKAAVARALLSNLRRDIGERELAALTDRLRALPNAPQLSQSDIYSVRNAQGPGNMLSLALEFEHVTELLTCIGERGKPAQHVADDVATQAAAYLAAEAPVGEYLCDQLLVPLAVTAGGRFRATRWSPHAMAQANLINTFFPHTVSYQPFRGSDEVMVTVAKPNHGA